MVLSATRYDRVRFLWPDHLGLARGKYLSPARAAEGSNHCVALFSLQLNRVMIPHPGAHHESFPDVEARFSADDIRPGWEKGTGVVVASITKDGDPIELAPRSILERVVADWKAMGLTPMIGFELEAFLFEPDGDRGWRPIHTPGSYVYGTGTSVDPSGTIDEVMDTAREMGIELESVNSEYDDGQFELTLRYDEALKAADDAFLFKVMAKEVAAKRGYLLTFMGKPITERGGSGIHINFSLMDDNGQNVLSDPSDPSGIGSLARQCIAGMVHDHVSMTALVAPTVNAYKRLQPGSLNGYYANWGYDHRGVAVRIPPTRGEGTRLEHRLADGATSVHLAAAATLVAALRGVSMDLECPPAETQDCITGVDTDVTAPASLEAALDALEADKEFVEAFSPSYVEGFLAIKRAEWERYLTHTTDWEIGEYLEYY
ncbi:MAG TPA: glutamine synthetase [Acidimicrobiia bacterium]|nr:glutamine synthetase [Acidimicrobiia bacterium]